MSEPALSRRLGLFDAVVIGLGSMIGAGVFAAFTPAAQAAGSGLLVGLAVAAVVAWANATSSAQLAAVYPKSGGTYLYGRAVLGPWWGFMAGWSFVIGKIASCAAMALIFAAHAAPTGWERPVAVLAVLALAAVNYRGVTRTARLARVVVAVSLLSLTLVVASGVASGVVHEDAQSGIPPSEMAADAASAVLNGGWHGVLQSAGLLFFAFAGYARIATMGEEVRDPARTIPRAITIALGITVVVYAAIAVTVLSVLGPESVARSTSPLVDTVTASGWAWAGPVVSIGAAAASLGALLALMTGIGRTTLAMAREGDLPRWLSAVHPKFRVPHRAEVALAVVVVVLVLVIDVRGAIGFSSFGVLLYYFVANAAALRQPRSQRRYPRALQVFGAVACIVLVATLPWQAVVVGIAVVAAGALGRLLARTLARRRIRAP